MNNTESTASGEPLKNRPTWHQSVPAGGDDHPDIYVGGASGPVRRSGDVIITEVHGANLPNWSVRRAVVTSAIVFAFFGSVFFAGYAATSAWICSARLDCGHWAPIAIVATGGVIASTVIGGIGGYLLHRLYRVFKVA